MLSSDEKRQLLELARAALESRVRRSPAPDIGASAASGPGRGAFVTVLCNGELRGCLGRIASELPLARLVHQLAQSVADSDPRFEAVRQDELVHITLEISVLTSEREIQSVTEIEIGRHGLIVEHGSRRGLLLPQVPAEHGWDRDTFVRHTCLKAGLDADAWRRGVRMFVFEAQVFGEGD